jgi:hypothetical protein
MEQRDGTMEEWNNGMLGVENNSVFLPIIPVFHYSNIPYSGVW